MLFVVNLISVKLFGELEFWFAAIKIAAIVMMILVGIGVLVFGFSDAGDTAGSGICGITVVCSPRGTRPRS